MAQNKIIKDLSLDLSGIPENKVAKAKKAVGEFIINEIILVTEKGQSPVEGEGKFKKLTSEYAKEQKGGRTTPNLKLEGDMFEALKYKDMKGNKLRIGILDEEETDKADGHNQFSSKAKAWAAKKDFPKRRFIPDSQQKFTDEINNGISDVLDEYREEPGRKPVKITESERTELQSTALAEILNERDIVDILQEEGYAL